MVFFVDVASLFWLILFLFAVAWFGFVVVVFCFVSIGMLQHGMRCCLEPIEEQSGVCEPLSKEFQKVTQVTQGGNCNGHS